MAPPPSTDHERICGTPAASTSHKRICRILRCRIVGYNIGFQRPSLLQFPPLGPTPQLVQVDPPPPSPHPRLMYNRPRPPDDCRRPRIRQPTRTTGLTGVLRMHDMSHMPTGKPPLPLRRQRRTPQQRFTMTDETAGGEGTSRWRHRRKPPEPLERPLSGKSDNESRDRSAIAAGTRAGGEGQHRWSGRRTAPANATN